MGLHNLQLLMKYLPAAIINKTVTQLVKIPQLKNDSDKAHLTSGSLFAIEKIDIHSKDHPQIIIFSLSGVMWFNMQSFSH